MVDYVQRFYQQLQLADPANIIADIRYPQVKRQLVEIEAVQKEYMDKSDNRNQYLNEMQQLLVDYQRNRTIFDYDRLQRLMQFMIKYSSNAQPDGTVPTLTARVSSLTNDLRYDQSIDEYALFSMLSYGLTLARIKTTNNSSLTVRDNALINEVWIGFVYLNRLKNTPDPSPYFKYIYGAYYCGKIQSQQPNMAEACCGGGSVFYSLEENVIDAIGLNAWLDNSSRIDREYAVMYVQLIKALYQAASVGVNNFTIKGNDIIIRQLTIQFDWEGRTYKVRGVPVFIDYTKCLASNITNRRYTPVAVTIGDVDALRQMFSARLRATNPTLAKFISTYPNDDLKIDDNTYDKLK